MKIKEIELDNKNQTREIIEQKKSNEMEEFIGQLEKFINENNPLRNKQNSNIELEENIYVVKDRKKERLTVVNILNGIESDIFIAKSEKDIQIFNNNNIFKNIYGVSEHTFYNIDLGSNLILKNANCEIYNKKIEIKNNKAKQKLEELYFCLKEEEGKIYTIDKIKEEKIYLTSKEGGYFSIYKQAYPELKEGNKVKKQNGKYIIIK